MSEKSRRRGTRRRRAPIAMIVTLLGGLLLVVAAIAMAVSGGSGGRRAIEVTGQARLKLDQDLVDLGDVRLGRTVEASFQLTNVGDQPLQLTEPPWIEVLEGC